MPGAIAFLNPLARSGSGADHNTTVTTVLAGRHVPAEIRVFDRPVKDASARAEAWRALIRGETGRETVLYPAGGDGTMLEVSEAALTSAPDSGAPRSVEELKKLRFPPGVTLNGVGTGSAQDIKAVLGFPTPDELETYLARPQDRQLFHLGATWLVTGEENGNFQARLANHSLSYGLVSYVFSLREKYYQAWKADPDNAGKTVPFYLNTLAGRVLQAPRAALNQALKYLKGFRGHTVRVTMPDGQVRQFNDTVAFGVFGLPIAGNYFGLPYANPLAGDHYRVTVAAVPFHPISDHPVTVGLLALEGMVRGLAAKLGLKSAVGGDFWSLKFLNRFGAKIGIWETERIFTLTHDDEITIEVMDRVVAEDGLMDLVEHDGVPVLNGDIAGKIRTCRIVVGPREQTLPFWGTKGSIAGFRHKRDS